MILLWGRNYVFVHIPKTGGTALALALALEARAMKDDFLIGDTPKAQARKGQETCSLYLRLKHRNHNIAAFEAHLGFQVSPSPRANASIRNTDWRGYHTDADAALLAVLCAEDIARFGYRFDDIVKGGAG